MDIKEEVKKSLKEENLGFCLGYLENILIDGLVWKYGFSEEEAKELIEIVMQKYIKGE